MKICTVDGLLCYSCNVALGLLDDDITRLQSLVLYLKKSRIKKLIPLRKNLDGAE